MSLQIVAYKGFALTDRSGGGQVLQVPDGAPLELTAANFTGSYTVPANCYLIKIAGTGTITWPSDTDGELFDGVEFRGVRPGQQFTVA